MNLDTSLLNADERIILALRALYRAQGYTQFKMSKFEEYDLYARNKDFLISDNILTFTDTGGRLMALKPDVTLSIVRSSRGGAGTQKVFYNENVYRVTSASGAFRELTQTGLECIGDVGAAETAEVVVLAMRSLERVAADWRLAVSHLGVLSGLLERLEIAPAARGEVLRCVSEKNPHELARLCAEQGVPAHAAAALQKLITLYGPAETVLPELRALGCGAEAAELEALAAAAEAAGLGGRLDLDLSIVSNLNYYNGTVFKGYVSGVPEAVLSGGRYDQLLRKLGRAGRAIGFAVYVDMLTEFDESGAGAQI